MAGVSNAFENQIIDHITGKTSSTAGSKAAYIGLVTVAIGDTDTLSTITEANYTGYARKALAGSGGDFNAASSGSASNANAITFAACTAGSSTVIGWFLTDAASGTSGTISFYGTCASTVISTTQTPATFAAGALSLAAE